MQPCRRVGLDALWYCNWFCKHCFYRHNPKLGTHEYVPVEKLLEKVDLAKAGGCDHVVIEGFGEPSLYKDIDALARQITAREMSWSMITNGATGIKRFEHFFNDLGIDHLHISSHGNLDVIAERKGAQKKQDELKAWLRENQLPFRTNVTMQQESYLHMVDTIKKDIDFGSLHLVNMEWNYDLQIHDRERLWAASKQTGDKVACEKPCKSECSAYRHCGGYNKHMGFADSLVAIKGTPDYYRDQWQQDGGLIDLNPATTLPSELRYHMVLMDSEQ